MLLEESNGVRVYGPYPSKSTGRQIVDIIDSTGKRKQTNYSRYLMEKKLGRELKRKEEVHHINETKSDDSIDNLEVIHKDKHKYMTTHPTRESKINKIDLKCPICHTTFSIWPSKLNKIGNCCSKSCALKLRAKLSWKYLRYSSVHYN